MGKLYLKILAIVLLVFGLAVSFVAEAANVVLDCQNGVCVSVVDDLPDRSTGINPNTNVNLSFSVYQEDSGQPPACSSGRRLFYVLKHNINGNADYWEFIRTGEGAEIGHSFNSGQYGQRNRYSGFFYCSSVSFGTDKDTVDRYLSLRANETPSEVWPRLPTPQFPQVPEFNLTTRNNPQLPVESSAETDVETTDRSVSLDFSNPLRSETVGDLIDTIMSWLRIIVIPIAVIVIVVSGVVMMYAGSKADVFTEAKKALLWAVVGLVVILIGEGFTRLIESIIELKNR